MKYYKNSTKHCAPITIQNSHEKYEKSISIKNRMNYSRDTKSKMRITTHIGLPAFINLRSIAVRRTSDSRGTKKRNRIQLSAVTGRKRVIEETLEGPIAV